MCLSAVYKLDEEPDSPVFDSVKDFRIDDGVITFTDILGDELSIKGRIDRVDFVENAIYVVAG